MASSVTYHHIIPSLSSTKATNPKNGKTHLSSSLWGSPISITTLSANPTSSVDSHSRRRLSVTAMAPPKAKPGGKAKKVIGMLKLALEAGKATPAPPVGLALGSNGVNIMAFCKDYNSRTADSPVM